MPLLFLFVIPAIITNNYNKEYHCFHCYHPISSFLQEQGKLYISLQLFVFHHDRKDAVLSLLFPFLVGLLQMDVQ